jgi:hypothetical protein
MTGTLESVRQLPKWFDLGKYGDAGPVSLQDWATSFFMRSTLAAFLDWVIPRDTATPFVIPDNDVAVKRIWTLIHEKGGRAHEYFFPIGALPQPAVADLSVKDFFDVARVLSTTGGGRYALTQTLAGRALAYFTSDRL